MRLRLITITLLIFASTGVVAARASSPPRPRELDGGALYPAPSVAATGGTGASGATGATGTTGSTGSSAVTGASGATTNTGPTPLSPALEQTVPGLSAAILPDGYAAAPAGAPAVVQQAIWAANQLIGQPYVYGGGHQSFDSAGYDCSGAVSYALHGAGLLLAPLDSTSLESWGTAGQGAWITVYTNPTHAFVEIAGLRLDTSTAGEVGGLAGPRWRPLLASTTGYLARYPEGY